MKRWMKAATATAWGATVVAVALLLAASQAAAAGSIRRVLPFTPEVDTVRVVTTVRPDAGAARLQLTGTLTAAAGDKAIVWEGRLGEVAVRGDAVASTEVTLPKLNVRPWSPATPILYELTVTARENGKVVDSKTARFGFRKIESKGGQFHLNGRPIFLRGLAINPPGRGVPASISKSRQFALDSAATWSSRAWRTRPTSRRRSRST
ncbi:MAG TPA: hypothetical protein VER17_02905 [Tepidisphaeraceae bacterium]|nr:hypothetical protein [Tepidisphaeraceae bacterium]